MTSLPLRGLVPLLCLLCPVLQAQADDASFDHVIELSLQAGSGDVRILDRVRVTAREQYRFRLADWLTRVEARIDGNALQLRREGDDYVIDLPEAGAHSIDFELHGVVPARNDANARELGSSAGGDGIFLPAYDDWIPWQSGTRLRYRLEVSVPSSQRAAATGKLVDESIGHDRYRASFVSTHAGEAPSVFAGPYQVRERISQGLRLRTYFHTELADQADAYLAAADRYIRRYQQLIGDYPYTDFYIISAPLPVGLGFPNLTYVGRQVIPLPFMRTRSLAHEVLHNWWGNGVEVDYASGNWAEGLTTYLADYGLAEDQGEAQAREMRVKWLRDYAALPAERDRPLSEFRSKRHQAAQVIGYNKAAFVFHMLRREIGERAFFDALKDFWRKHRYGRAGWYDLQISFEQAAHRRLGWFFEQWLQHSGAPRLSLGSHQVEAVDGGYLTRIEILQPVAGYRFRLDALLATETGAKRRQLFIEESVTHVEWITPTRPLSIQFDPQSNLFRRLHKAETPPILRDITLNPQTVTLIAGEQPGFNASARDLAGRLLDTEARFLEPGQPREPWQPLLLIAPFDRLAEQLERLQLQAPADLPAMAYGAVAWTTRLRNNTPVLVIAAKSVDELRSMLRPLPHYGGQSYVLFDNGRALGFGLWPLSHGALYRDLATGS